MDLGLEGKVAIVTGGSDGIGKAAAISMASEGAKVAIVVRTQSKLDDAVAEIKKASGGEAIGFAADVSVESDVKTMVEKVVAEYGKLDILVNNAGTSIRQPMEKMSLKTYEKIIKTNHHQVQFKKRAIPSNCRLAKGYSCTQPFSSLAVPADHHNRKGNWI